SSRRPHAEAQRKKRKERGGRSGIADLRVASASPEGALVNSPGRQPRVACCEQTTKPRRGDSAVMGRGFCRPFRAPSRVRGHRIRGWRPGLLTDVPSGLAEQILRFQIADWKKCFSSNLQSEISNRQWGC